MVSGRVDVPAPVLQKWPNLHVSKEGTLLESVETVPVYLSSPRPNGYHLIIFKHAT